MNQIRSLFSRNHDTVLPKLGVFLAGPTPPDGEMQIGWRRVVMEALKEDKRLDASIKPSKKKFYCWKSRRCGKPEMGKEDYPY